MADTKSIYIMKRYPKGYFATINTTEGEKKAKEDLLKDFSNSVFVNHIVTKLKNVYNNTKYADMVCDVIYMENDITNKGGYVTRKADTLGLYSSEVTYAVVFDAEKNKYVETSMLGYYIGNSLNNDRLTSYDENRALTLMPSIETYYGIFEGVYNIPYCYRSGGTVTNYGVTDVDVFKIGDDLYAIGINNTSQEARYVRLYNYFIYKLMLD